MTHHESSENYLIETIIENEPKAKDIKVETKPNGDMDVIFKVSRKNHRIVLTNLEFEKHLGDSKKPFVEPMQEYWAELDKATAELREKHKDMLEGYQQAVSDGAKEFMITSIDNYFSLEEELGLTK